MRPVVVVKANICPDLRNIRIHLNALRRTNEPRPSLRDKLSTCLEQALQGVETPSPTALHQPMSLANMTQDFDYTWQIFSQASLQPFLDPEWPGPSELQCM